MVVELSVVCDPIAGCPPWFSPPKMSQHQLPKAVCPSGQPTAAVQRVTASRVPFPPPKPAPSASPDAAISSRVLHSPNFAGCPRTNCNFLGPSPFSTYPRCLAGNRLMPVSVFGACSPLLSQRRNLNLRHLIMMMNVDANTPSGLHHPPRAWRMGRPARSGLRGRRSGSRRGRHRPPPGAPDAPHQPAANSRPDARFAAGAYRRGVSASSAALYPGGISYRLIWQNYSFSSLALFIAQLKIFRVWLSSTIIL